MNERIEEYLADLMPELGKMGIQISDEREIMYGIQLRFYSNDKTGAHTPRAGRKEVVLNIYYSAKKGVTTIVGGDAKSKLGLDIKHLLDRIQVRHKPLPLHQWKSWIGSDECGKGDYFGALVGCAVAIDDGMLADLRAMRVIDSKLLSDIQIKAIAGKLYQKYRQRINCLVLKPVKYNELYDSFRAQGKNLNDLLAWLHYTLIRGLAERSASYAFSTQKAQEGNAPSNINGFAPLPELDGVIVDQFSVSSKVQRLCQQKQLGIPVMERHHAEADPAVAAASILARYQFLQAHQEMREHYQIDFPLGASGSIAQPFKEFISRYSERRLNEVVKLHFKTTAKYLQGLNQSDLFDPGREST
ncbi:MAG: ribonuclease HIII [Candidatus Cloacimonetes bacterium]|nr:ribonuclease HIII [Candidatus Cloacimonadota bacterium]